MRHIVHLALTSTEIFLNRSNCLCPTNVCLFCSPPFFLSPSLSLLFLFRSYFFLLSPLFSSPFFPSSSSVAATCLLLYFVPSLPPYLSPSLPPSLPTSLPLSFSLSRSSQREEPSSERSGESEGATSHQSSQRKTSFKWRRCEF